MTVLTLLTKAYGASQLQQINEALKLTFQGLGVETKILGTIADGWVQIELAGEDEKIATNYLIKEIGVCPRTLVNLKKSSTLKGYLSNLNSQALFVDIGVFEPKIIPAIISSQHLQAQLMAGTQVLHGRLTELFGFCKGLPLNVKITRLNEAESYIEVELSSKQIDNYTLWRESLLDRLIVLGVSLNEVKKALAHAKLHRDIIDVEPLGLLEHALTCKLGTDARGLIPKIGAILIDANFAVFNSKSLFHKMYCSTF